MSPPSSPIQTYPLTPPSLSILQQTLTSSLSKSFSQVHISIIPCPNLTLPPFYLASPGLCGRTSIVDLGGPPFLHPVPDFEKRYPLPEIISLVTNSEKGKGEEGQDGKEENGDGNEERFAIGAGAGPFWHLGQNTELIPNLSLSLTGEVKNLTHYAKITSSSTSGQKENSYACLPINKEVIDCALMANLFLSSGQPGDVLHIKATGRIAKESFTTAIQSSLQAHFSYPVALGGVFLVHTGKVRCHIMPDFCKERLEDKDMGKWLRFFEWEGKGIVFLTSLCSRGEEWALRGEHTHCFSVDGSGRGGHYHGDLNLDGEGDEEVEYEGWFNVASFVHRVDMPGWKE